MAMETVKGQKITLNFDGKRCIHARFCVTGAPKTFLANVQGPWIHPDATPVETLHRAQEIGLEEGLHYVYLGNVTGESNTHCHECDLLLIRRCGYWISENRVRDGRCPNCGAPVAGVGMQGE